MFILSFTYAQRFELHTDHTIKDKELNLRWLFITTKKLNYDNATYECRKYRTRIPTEKELKSLFYKDQAILPFSLLSNSKIWSNTLLDNSFPLVFTFNGSGMHTYDKKNKKHNVLCVTPY